ncbi:MAG: 2-C-methyl-D-erythritol 4-phosphate cytidylyltransferase [Bacteroidales bacterium]|nr:2-C-methyl-D-erythritol 4-phosphate cytidylyltransferase [Bacteroidales bacterium]
MQENTGNEQIMQVAVILAGGSGRRFGSPEPKQFMPLRAKTVLEYSVDAFELHPRIDEIAVVVHPDYMDKVEEMVRVNHWQKVKRILQGGAERYESTLSAIRSYTDKPSCNMIFHDAARPFVSARIISDVVAALQDHEAVDVAIPVTDTILQTDASKSYIQNVPDRNALMASQTPQAFSYSVISEAYRRALESGPLHATDDCGIVLRFMPEIPIFIVSGDVDNFKVTYPSDLDRMNQYIDK